MKMLYWDCNSGISGDMILAAFFDGLVPVDVVEEYLNRLPLGTISLKVTSVRRNGVAAKHLEIVHEGEAETLRTLPQIERLLQESALPDGIQQKTLSIFKKLAEVEARIHQTTPEKVHCHEIGAVDTIVDIVGTLICLDHIKPDMILGAPLPLGRGRVKTEHGILPLPAPATLELLKGLPVSNLDVNAETVTPTGAVLYATLVQGTLPTALTFTVEKVGYGAGNQTFPQLPNVLRIWEGQLLTSHRHELVMQVETSIDDMNPELYPYLMEQLLGVGVFDVSLYPNIMKKGRPGVLVSILCDPVLLPTVKDILFRETTTLGLRYQYIYREKVDRELVVVDTPWGKVRVKKIRLGEQERWSPEYEECRRIAREQNRPIRDIYEQLMQQFRSRP